MAIRRSVLLFLVLVLGFALMPGAGATEPGGVYMSMGDSVAAGTRPNVPITNTAYTDVLFRRIGDDLGLATHMDISCPGETSGGLISGADSHCFVPGISQLDLALAFIAGNPGAVQLITIDIGANDVLACTEEDDMKTCVGAALPALAFNLQHILLELRTATGWAVPIVAMNYYNPLMAWQLSSDPFDQGLAAASPGLVGALNDLTLAPVYEAFGVPMADVARKFKSYNTRGAVYPRNLRYVCRFTYMCERDRSDLVLSDWQPAPGDQPDIHPTPGGHRKIASAFQSVMESAGIL